MKKGKFYLLLIALLSLILVGCGNADTLSNDVEEESIANLSTDQDVLLFSTLSSASVLSNSLSTVNTLSTSLLSSKVFGENKEKEEIEVDMEKANQYLLMMENLLSDGGPIVSNEGVSDREGYDTMMVISVKNLAGNVSTYTIYYSIITDEEETPVVPEESVEETPVEGETTNDEVPTVSARHRDDEKTEDHYDERTEAEHHEKVKDHFKNHHYHEKDEEEFTYEINALAVIDGVEYEVMGKKEVESDDDGEEVEIKFVVKLDDRNYVRIEQELEDDSIEYQYSVYKDGRKFSTMKFESEEENGATVAKITTNENGYIETYKFFKGEDKTIIKYSGNGYSYTLFVTSVVDEETGEIVYDYKVKEKEFNWSYKKGHKGR